MKKIHSKTTERGKEKAKMKIATITIAILLMSAIIAPLALALESNNVQSATATVPKFKGIPISKTIASSDFSEESAISESDVDSILNSVSSDPELKRFGTSKIWNVVGSINNGEEGHIINGFWISQTFVKNEESNDIAQSKRIRGKGMLNVLGTKERLFIVRSNEDEPEDDRQEFYVMSNARSAVAIKDTGTDKIGTLVIEREAEYEGLTRWSGELTLDSGELEGEWEVELSTSLRNIRKTRASADEIAGYAGEGIRAKEVSSNENKGLAGFFRRIFKR